MTVLEDILDDIESNGGHITKIENSDDSITITYTDSDGNLVTKSYTMSIADDGTEDWTEV